MTEPMPVGGPVGGVRARRTPAWVIVALTLGGVVVLALTFIGGLVAGIAISPSAGGVVADGSAGQSGASNDGSTGAGGAASSSASPGSLDPCLVGTWKAVEHSETFNLKEQGPTTVSGLVRTLTFDADGNETVTYDRAQARLKVTDGEGTVVFDGTVKYRASTTAGTITFHLLSSEATVTVRKPDGSEESQPLKPGAGSVKYTCDAKSFVQTADGFRSAYEKVG